MASLWLFGSLAISAIGVMAAPPAPDPVRVDPNIAVRDIHGSLQHPFLAPKGHAAVVFFVATDCPVANGYAPEIRRICEAYKAKAGCTLAYVDPTLSTEAVSKHVIAYQHGDYPAVIDTKHLLVKASGATVTPEVVVVLSGGAIAYRGRIDDKYFALGRSRQNPVERNLRDVMENFVAGKPILTARTTPVGCFITPLEFFTHNKN